MGTAGRLRERAKETDLRVICGFSGYASLFYLISLAEVSHHALLMTLMKDSALERYQLCFKS